MHDCAPRTIGSLRGGDHVCLVYDSDAEHEAVLSAFVVGGLERRERVLYFTDNQPIDTILYALQGRGIDTERHIARGRLSVATAQASYLAAGRFDPQACIQAWLETAKRAIADGYSGIRVGGDLGWAARGISGANQLLEYERRIQAEVFPSGLVTGMCEIDRRRFNDSDIEALLGVHPDGALSAHTLPHVDYLQILPTLEPYGAKIFGEIDILSEDTFHGALHQLAAASSSDIYLDFGGVRFMGTSALSALARLAKDLDGERRVIVLNLAPRFRQVMEVLGWRAVPGLTFSER